MNRCEDSHSTLTARAFKNVQFPHPSHQFGPGIIRPCGTGAEGRKDRSFTDSSAALTESGIAIQSFVTSALFCTTGGSATDDGVADEDDPGTIQDLHLDAGANTPEYLTK